MPATATGRAIFITGVPASGKSTVGAKLKANARTFGVLKGDRLIRETSFEDRMDQHVQLWERLLATVASHLNAGRHIIVDAALREDQVIEARARLGTAACFVLLKIDEDTRARRQGDRDRVGRRLGATWRPEWNSLTGPDEIYDLVVDGTNENRPKRAAEEILEFARRRWPDEKL